MSRISNRATVRTESAPLAVTVDEACRLTGLGRTSLYNLMSAGKLAYVKPLASKRLIPIEALRTLVSKP